MKLTINGKVLEVVADKRYYLSYNLISQRWEIYANGAWAGVPTSSLLYILGMFDSAAGVVSFPSGSTIMDYVRHKPTCPPYAGKCNCGLQGILDGMEKKGG